MSNAERRDAAQFGREQNRWFSDLLSISRDSLLSGNAGEWLVLDQVESPLLWGQLRSGAEVGIVGFGDLGFVRDVDGGQPARPDHRRVLHTRDYRYAVQNGAHRRE